VAIITTDAAGLAARLYDRMPVVLADADMMQAWLSPEVQLDDVPALLAPLAGNRMTVQPASGLVNSFPTMGPSCSRRPSPEPTAVGNRNTPGVVRSSANLARAYCCSGSQIGRSGSERLGTPVATKRKPGPSAA
jgi:hypothetical protein